MGLRIKELRRDKGLTGEQLADMVGVSKGYISEIENGKKTPGAGLMMRFADALKCEVYELYEGTLAEQKDAALLTPRGGASTPPLPPFHTPNHTPSSAPGTESRLALYSMGANLTAK